MEEIIAIPTWAVSLIGIIFSLIFVPMLVWIVGNVSNHRTEIAVMKTGFENLSEKLGDLTDNVKQLANKFEQYLDEDRRLMKESRRK